MAERVKPNEIPQEAVIRHLLRSESNYISPQDPKICGLFTTSTEMLSRMIQTGKLVERTIDLECMSNEIAVTPTPAIEPRLTKIRLNENIKRALREPNELRNNAIDHLTPQDHFFLSQLGLPLDDPELLTKPTPFLGLAEDKESSLSEKDRQHIET